MFGATGMAAARTRYSQVDLGSKVEGASPHRLIGILYEELLKTLDAITAGMAAGSKTGMIERRGRASSILLGLEGSLDHTAGGEVSQGLASVYRVARRLVCEGISANDPSAIAQARDMVAEIAGAWEAIG